MSSLQAASPRPLGERDFIHIWDQGDGRHPIDRALIILRAAFPWLEWENLAALPLGRRDALLLRLRIATFGPQLSLQAPCAHCLQRFELEQDAEELMVADPLEPAPLAATIVVEDMEITVRPLTSLDLLSMHRGLDRRSGDLLDQGRCILLKRAAQVRQGGSTVSPLSLPPTLVKSITATASQIDPMATLVIFSKCPFCRRKNRSVLDVPSLLWDEILMAAKRGLGDVTALAKSFGWAERDILSMSPSRRRFYLRQATQ
jgi:hypothetical protein